MHMRMMAMAEEHVRRFLLQHDAPIECVFSPVHDCYPKAGLEPATRRVEMLRLAIQETHTRGNWSVNDWECTQPAWTPTANVLDHFDEDGSTHVLLVAATDLLASFNMPDLWSDRDIERILAHRRGVLMIERSTHTLSETTTMIIQREHVYARQHHIHMIGQPCPFIVSSSAVRALCRVNGCITGLVSKRVEEYVREHQLFGIQ